MILNAFLITVILAFYLRSLKNILYQTFLWQLREYRLDRMIAHLKTPVGRKLYSGILPLSKWLILLFTYGLALFNIYFPVQNFTYPVIIYGFYAIWLIWLLEALRFLKEIATKKARIPQWTIKSVSLVILAFLFQLYLFWLNPLAPLFLGIIFDKLLPIILTALIIIFSIPTKVYRKVLIFFARRKIKTLSKLRIIGITGSFGKTSTKEFIAALLGVKYKVGSTFESQNTLISLARYILKNLDASFNFLIVEAAAYKKGEISQITSMAKPELAVISGIGDQHLELFGSREKLVEAKFELISSLPANSPVIFNAANKESKEIINKAKESGYRIIKADGKKYFSEVSVGKNTLEFKLKINGRAKKLKVNLLGRHNLENLALALSAAELLGLSAGEIVKGLGRIRSPKRTMQIIRKTSDLTSIDDTFNVNSQAVLAALDYLKLYRGNRIMVLTPLIELGTKASQVHLKLGRAIGQVCDYLILTNNNYFQDISLGVKETGKTKIIKGLNELPPDLKNDSIIVFEGKEARKYV